MRPIILLLFFMLYPLIFWSQNRLTVNGDAQVSGTLNLGQVVIDGPDNNGSIAGLEISSGSQKIIIDGNELDCLTTGMFLNLNSQNDLFVRTGDRRAELNLGHDTGSGTSNGLAIENEGGNNVYWTLYSTNGDGNFELYYNGSIRGEFTSSSGAYAQVSDRRLKQNIRLLGSTLEKVQRLRPTTYTFRSDRQGRPHLGFIAQDVQQVFPELVNKSTLGDTDEELLTLDYSGFGVVAIAAIRELLEKQNEENAALRAENRDMKRQISRLSDRLDQLENRLSLCCRAADASAERRPEDQWMQADDRPQLGQNVPNPFRQQTTIPYYIPETVTQAEILVLESRSALLYLIRPATARLRSKEEYYRLGVTPILSFWTGPSGEACHWCLPDRIQDTTGHFVFFGAEGETT